ncbi:hypothetical protein JKP88DRAFT_207086 [Tribonema minus]|uniref:PH domain-containing protein n=1 Tax=Tribonema minus TaxID=303371 RepID=A0A836CJC0_9STRA|nr:hypothetical protein JKP88DRAFT_207086 [Tribonema minus]
MAAAARAPPQMSGYLHKKAKTGKWQRRWFETNAHFLTYYKTRKVEKLLAALNLPQVGEIKLVDPDPNDPENNGALFTIELNTRVYTMKAGTREEAARWVEVLKALQAMDVDDARHAGAESPHASIVRTGEGTDAPGPDSYWRKDSKCCGCFRA